MEYFNSVLKENTKYIVFLIRQNTSYVCCRGKKDSPNNFEEYCRINSPWHDIVRLCKKRIYPFGCCCLSLNGLNASNSNGLSAVTYFIRFCFVEILFVVIPVNCSLIWRDTTAHSKRCKTEHPKHHYSSAIYQIQNLLSTTLVVKVTIRKVLRPT